MEQLDSKRSVQPEGSSLEPAPRKREPAGKLTEWQRFFLERLDYLLSVQRRVGAEDASHVMLVSKAVYSTYLDCQTQGVGEEALQRITSNSSGAPSAN